ncbi:MAG: exosortase system-associated protein, TIGR04073 family [Candidatus Omnitrophota bacterium]|nr:exosortase system-associated protein, TIGR04073 family [Candidatus Omnitrophota bacterium]
MDAQRVGWQRAAKRTESPAARAHLRRGVFGIRIVMMLASPSLLSGCIFGTLNAELRRTRRAIDEIEARVTQLERARLTGAISVISAPVAVEGGGLVGGGAFPSSVEDPGLLAATDAPIEGVATTGGRLPQVPLPPRAAFVKLLRGMVNLLTGWVEIPKRVHETSRASGAGSGFTFGVVRGLGYGFVRTAGGVYEMATFLFPAPPDYRPVMRPDYIFVCETEESYGP